VAGLPLEDIEWTVHSLQATELAVFVGAHLLTELAGAGWVTLSLRPLHRVTTTARQVTSRSLARILAQRIRPQFGYWYW